MDATTNETTSRQSPPVPTDDHLSVNDDGGEVNSGDGNGNDDTGIDVKEAVSILSSRARAKARARTKRQQLEHPNAPAPIDDNSNNGGEIDGTTVTDEQRKMGQTIDLLRSQEWVRVGSPDGCGDGPPPPTDPVPATTIPSTTATDANAVERRRLLSTLPPHELLRTLFRLQEERVLAYRRFDAGLDIVLDTGNLTGYTHLAASVTAAFMVLSGSVRDVEGVFRKTGSWVVVKWIEKLQGLEKEKLGYTAALHLEKIRGRNGEVEREIAIHVGGSAGGGGGDGGNERIAKLLEESIVSLEGKVRGCIEGINDVLEELRYAAAEMEEQGK